MQENLRRELSTKHNFWNDNGYYNYTNTVINDADDGVHTTDGGDIIVIFIYNCNKYCYLLSISEKKI